MPIKRWRTTDMVRLLTDIRWKVEVFPQGGDVDTTNLSLTAKGAKKDTRLHIRGFVTDGKYITTPDDCGIEMVEVSDGQESRGGLNTACLKTGIMYATVCSTLRQMGYEVVPSLDAYF